MENTSLIDFIAKLSQVAVNQSQPPKNENFSSSVAKPQQQTPPTPPKKTPKNSTAEIIKMIQNHNQIKLNIIKKQ